MAIAPLAHTRTGSGDPVVLIHGIGHRRQAWDPIVTLLAKEREVIQIDLAGFGESPGFPAGTGYTMDNACLNLAQNFDEWGLARPHVVGNSLGGAIALELGARGLVRSVVAVSPAGFFGHVDKLVTFATLMLLKVTSYLPAGLTRRLLGPSRMRKLVGRALFEHGDRISLDDFMGDTLALRNGSAFFPTLASGARYAFRSPVEVPTTIAWGTRDKILPYAQSGRAQERLPDARFVALPGCGHVPMIDDPELVARVILEATSL